MCIDYQDNKKFKRHLKKGISKGSNAQLILHCRPAQVQHHFSVEALIGVLRKAMLKRKYIRDEKTQDKLDLRGKEETSRSNSQASDTRPVLPQQSSTGMCYHVLYTEISTFYAVIINFDN